MKYPTPVVRVILENSDREILFLKRASKTGVNKWCLPGGKVDFGKTIEGTCIDELKQETDLGISDLKFFFYDEVLPSSIDEHHWISFYFTARYSGKIKLNNESSDFHWIFLNELEKYDIAFGHDKVIQRYFSI